MAELKTKKNDADVGAFLDGIQNEKRRQDWVTHVSGTDPGKVAERVSAINGVYSVPARSPVSE